MLPDTLTLTGVVRDFKEKSVSGGHPDFERKPDGGFGQYAYMCADDLDEDDKPVFASRGYRVTSSYTDANGDKIMPPRDHVAEREGDEEGDVKSSEGGAMTSADTFAQWWRDVPGVNISSPLSLTLKRNPGTNMYTFDDKLDPTYQNNGGFFPINGELFGNSPGNDKNFHFTFELSSEFTYEEGSGQTFKFTGDDDVFVFIDGKCVIDIGGVHSAISQTIDLDRLEWLEDGQTYSLHFFFAERHRTQSNFRIDTTISLKNADLPTTTALYD